VPFYTKFSYLIGNTVNLLSVGKSIGSDSSRNSWNSKKSPTRVSFTSICGYVEACVPHLVFSSILSTIVFVYSRL
jgi:hypothetical protein